MPGVKRQGPTAKRRKSVKRVKTSKSLVSQRYIAYDGGKICSTFSPLPYYVRTRIRYMEKDIGLNPAIAGLAADQVFNITSLYDPNFTGTGHQPTGFDQMMALYRNYLVTKVNAHVIFQNTDSSNESLCCLHINDSTTSLTDIRVAVENGRCVYNMIGKAGSSRDITNLVISADIAKERGVKDLKDSPDYRGSVTSSPSASMYMHVLAQPNSANDATVVGVTVILEFDVMFLEPLSAALS